MTRVRFKDWDCIVEKRQYENGRPALRLIDAEDGSPIATAMVNLPNAKSGPNTVFVKDWSENEGMMAALIEAGVVKPTGETVRSGFVEVQVCELEPPFREPTHAERVDQTRGKGRSR